jgi:hypothetical protein
LDSVEVGLTSEDGASDEAVASLIGLSSDDELAEDLDA